MNRVVPALHDRHAPITLQEAFHEAIDAFDDWQLGMSEPAVKFEDKDIAISSIFGRMRHSEDVAPEKVRLAYLAAVGQEPPDVAKGARFTYGQAAARLRELSLERLRDQSQPSEEIPDEPSI